MAREDEVVPELAEEEFDPVPNRLPSVWDTRVITHRVEVPQGPATDVE